MTHGGWQGSGEAGPGPALQPAADACPARPPSPAKPTQSRRLEERPARPWDPGGGGQRPHLPRATSLCATPWPRGADPPRVSPAPAGHSGKLLEPRRREGRKGGERRRRGPGGQQPSPPGRRALLTSTIPPSPPAPRRGDRTPGHPSY
ncbi:putative uncharacterized protein SERTAD4-AS1 [Mustela putorius furo]|uniref:Uncharacterized protein n=1 Tax=Mustela putorius furo TaxID=9669 RepID=A0A8U0NAX3_MUSPF|nr:putative uncharacterized protein SERTAD4-AS1 [Mustela putorius furo]